MENLLSVKCVVYFFLWNAEIACNKNYLRTSTNVHGQVTMVCHWYTTSANIETRRQILLKVKRYRCDPVRNVKAYTECRSVPVRNVKAYTGVEVCLSET